MAALPQNLDPFLRIEKESLYCCYLLDGELRFLVEEAAQSIKQRALEGAAVDFNFDRFIGKDATIERIRDTCLMLPMFANYRVVWADHLEFTTADKWDALAKVLETLPSTTVLILSGNKFDARSKCYKWVVKNGMALQFDAPKEREMPERLELLAKRRNILISKEACFVLAGLLGDDLAEGRQQLEILSLYVGTEREIQKTDVLEVVAGNKEASVFDWVDAVANNDLVKAQTGLRLLQDKQREPSLRLLSLLVRQYRNLFKTRSLAKLGYTKDEMAGRIGIPSFAIQKSIDAAKRKSASELASALYAMAAADVACKGGSLYADHILERLMLVLCDSELSKD